MHSDRATGKTGRAATIGFGATLGAMALAQSTGPAHWWTPELDTNATTPQKRKVLLENEEVRVLEVTVAAGTREPLHVHRYPAVIWINPTPHVIVNLQDGASRDLGVCPPGAHCLPVAQCYAMEDVRSVPLHAIRVDLEKSR